MNLLNFFPPLSLIAGVYISSLLSTFDNSWAILASLLLFLLVGFLCLLSKSISRYTIIIIVTCVALLFVGIYRYQSKIPDLRDNWIQNLNHSGKITLCGRIVEEPEFAPYWQNIKVGDLTDEQNISYHGLLMLKVDHYPEYHFGENLCLKAKLEDPPEFEDFSYRGYLASQSIYSIAKYPDIFQRTKSSPLSLSAALINLRRQLAITCQRFLPEPESSLLSGILLGIKPRVSVDFYNVLQTSGTLHTVVISGQNITFVIAALLGLSGLIFPQKRLRIVVSIAGLLAYAVMVGGGSSVWRATLMGMAVLMTFALGRRQDTSTVLCLTAAVLVFWNPSSLWQVSFQLSFLATSGIIFLQDTIKQRLQVVKPLIREPLVTTLSAQLLVFPVLAHNFASFSLVGILANIAIFWLIPLITLLGSIFVGLSSLLPFLGQPLAAMVYIPLHLFVVIVEFFGSLPGAVVGLPSLNPNCWLLYYLAIGFVFVWRGYGVRRKASAHI